MKVIAYTLAAIIALPIVLLIVALMVGLFSLIWALGFPITITNARTKQKIGVVRWFTFTPVKVAPKAAK